MRRGEHFRVITLVRFQSLRRLRIERHTVRNNSFSLNQVRARAILRGKCIPTQKSTNPFLVELESFRL